MATIPIVPGTPRPIPKITIKPPKWDYWARREEAKCEDWIALFCGMDPESFRPEPEPHPSILGPTPPERWEVERALPEPQRGQYAQLADLANRALDSGELKGNHRDSSRRLLSDPVRRGTFVAWAHRSHIEVPFQLTPAFWISTDWRSRWADRETGALFELCAVALGIDPSRIKLTTTALLPVASAQDAINRFNNSSVWQSPRFEPDLSALSDDERQRLQHVLSLAQDSIAAGSIKPVAPAPDSTSIAAATMHTADFGAWLKTKTSLSLLFTSVPTTWQNAASAQLARALSEAMRPFRERVREDVKHEEMVSAFSVVRDGLAKRTVQQPPDRQRAIESSPRVSPRATASADERRYESVTDAVSAVEHELSKQLGRTGLVVGDTLFRELAAAVGAPVTTGKRGKKNPVPHATVAAVKDEWLRRNAAEVDRGSRELD